MVRNILLLFIALGPVLKGQVTMQNNIPAAIAPNTETIFEVKINKGSIVNFAKYQVDVPAGIILKEVDSKGGTFAFENNRAKIIWPVIPAEPEFSISLKLLSGNVGGPGIINQKFYYMDESARKEIDADAITVAFSGDDNATNIGPLKDGKPANTVSSQQAAQLKKDSKDAYETGLKEQQAAEKKLAEADEALKTAETIKDEEAKKAAIEKANATKQKAENDKAVSAKILQLAKSLDDNANEINRLNKAANPETTNPAPASSNTTAITTNLPNTAANTTSTPGSNLVYRLQLGAFSQNPEKALYRHMGTISIVNENNMYKVLMGKFATREDAVKKRDELVKRSFDCFIVTYKDGVRVK